MSKISATLLPLDKAYLPELPIRRDWRIGCLGAGFIMSDCHLVAYRQAGFNPVALASRRIDQALAVAERHSLPKVHHTIEDLLADDSIEILDIAVPPDVQPELIRRAVSKGRGRLRGILAQKPLALNLQEAKELVELTEAAGIYLAVNQNMRYDQSVRVAARLLHDGWLGEPVIATINMRAVPHWMPWAERQSSLSTFIMSIHHLDTFRYWLGTPDRVLASSRPDPRTKFPHDDGINLYILEYDRGARASSWDDVWTGPGPEGAARHDFIHWRLEGTEGWAEGSLGWPRYPDRCPSTLRAASLKFPGQWFEPEWSEVWFPDAFVGTMASLMLAVEQVRAPEISGRDNLQTLALCQAVRTAAQEHRVCHLTEFLV